MYCNFIHTNQRDAQIYSGNFALNVLDLSQTENFQEALLKANKTGKYGSAVFV